MRAFLLRRLGSLLLTLFAIVTLSFFVIRLAPGSPFDADRRPPKAVLDALNRQYGFDEPMTVQYVRYLNRLAHGDLGMSIKYPNRSINELVADGLPVTLTLALIALFWSLTLGLPAGVYAALRQNSATDHAAMAAAMVGISIPTFVLGPLLILVFSLTLYWTPPAGWGSVGHAILPGLTLGTAYAAYIARLTRGGMLEVTRSDFVRTARAKGLSEWTVVRRHMLRGGLLPVVTFLGPAVANLMVGSVAVEKIFATPGLGPYLVDAATNRDYFLVMGLVVVYSVFLLTMNALVDLAYSWLDPRIRYS